MLEYLIIAISGFWLTLPAMAANPMAVLFGGGQPVDFGKSLKSGTRILGDGKTWRGLAGGTASGTLLGFILIVIGSFGGYDGFGQLPRAFLIVFALSFGSLLGDMLGSFIKRRLDRKRGAKTPFLDQYDFLIGAYAMVIIVDWNWFYSHFISGNAFLALATVLVVTPLLHRGMNILGYKMGKKKEPW